MTVSADAQLGLWPHSLSEGGFYLLLDQSQHHARIQTRYVCVCERLSHLQVTKQENIQAWWKFGTVREGIS